MITHRLRYSLRRIVFITQCKTVWTISIHKQCHEKSVETFIFLGERCNTSSSQHCLQVHLYLRKSKFL